MMLTAVLLQAPLLGVAFLVEFSQRKKRSQREAVRPPAAAPTATSTEPTAPSSQPPPEKPRAKAAGSEESAGVQKAEREESPPAAEAPPVAVKPAPPEEEVSAPEVAPHAKAETSAQREAQAAVAVEPVVEEPEPRAPMAMPPRTPVRIGLGLRKTRESFLARVRAAAIEQLEVWCNRAGVDLIKQNQGSDPAAVAFDAVKAAVARKAKVVIVDTAGRLQTKVNLMEELKKIARVVGRELPGAPHETWLVLDATTGQNALSQAKLFSDAVPLSGVVLAKLDSTAKGGVIVGIAEQLKLPVRYVGLGEGIEDLRPFDPHEFVEALFSETEGEREAASGTYAA